MSDVLNKLRDNLDKAYQGDANTSYYISQARDACQELKPYVEQLEDAVATLSVKIVKDRKK